MNFSTVRQVIEKEFEDNYSSTARVYDNRPEPTGENEFVRLTILDGEAEQTSIGGNPGVLYRHTGLVVVQIFIKPETGTARARTLADTIAAIYRGKTLSGIIFRAPTINRGDLVRNWYQLNVWIPFQWDETF